MVRLFSCQVVGCETAGLQDDKGAVDSGVARSGSRASDCKSN